MQSENSIVFRGSLTQDEKETLTKIVYLHPDEYFDRNWIFTKGSETYLGKKASWDRGYHCSETFDELVAKIADYFGLKDIVKMLTNIKDKTIRLGTHDEQWLYSRTALIIGKAHKLVEEVLNHKEKAVYLQMTLEGHEFLEKFGKYVD